MDRQQIQDLRRQVIEKYREAAEHTAAAVEFDKYVERRIKTVENEAV